MHTRDVFCAQPEIQHYHTAGPEPAPAALLCMLQPLIGICLALPQLAAAGGKRAQEPQVHSRTSHGGGSGVGGGEGGSQTCKGASDSVYISFRKIIVTQLVLADFIVPYRCCG